MTALAIAAHTPACDLWPVTRARIGVNPESRSVLRVIAALTLSLAGCRSAGTDLAPPAVAPPALPAPAEVLARLRAGGAARRTLLAEGTVTYFGARGRVRGKAVIVARRPGAFRVETLSPLEQPVEVITTDGERLYLLASDTLRVGPATPENLAAVMPLPMRPEEVVDTLLGGVPASSALEPLDVAPGDGGRWVLSLAGAGGDLVELTIDPASGRVESTRLLARGGGLRASVEFGDFEPVGDAGPPLPRAIVIRMPRDDLDLRIRLTDVAVDTPVDDALFRLEPPPGKAAESLGAGAGPSP